MVEHTQKLGAIYTNLVRIRSGSSAETHHLAVCRLFVDVCIQLRRSTHTSLNLNGQFGNMWKHPFALSNHGVDSTALLLIHLFKVAPKSSSAGKRRVDIIPLGIKRCGVVRIHSKREYLTR